MGEIEIDDSLANWFLKDFDEEINIRKEGNHFVVEKSEINPFTLQKESTEEIAIIEKVDLIGELKRIVKKEDNLWKKRIEELI